MLFRKHLWLKFSLTNLLLVAILGSLMRYKIGFDLPILSYKPLLHSHSHFAFAGWVTHTLMVLMIYQLSQKSKVLNLPKYNFYLTANLITAYGMMISFIIQGYAFWSILFSTLSILVTYGFSYAYYKDLKRSEISPLVQKWFSGALLFLVLSSFGTFILGYMIASKNLIQSYQLGSVYYYLHFQYNGWFFFGIMGLLFSLLNITHSQSQLFHKIYPWFFISTLVTFFLSILWAKLPLWLILTSVFFAILQFVIWLVYLSSIIKNNRQDFLSIPTFLIHIIKFVAFCATLKFLFQMLSAIPSLSTLVFGYRSIIIGYLHLVLLAVISLFLLFYIYSQKLMPVNKTLILGLKFFTLGVFLNELILGIQGLSAFGLFLIPKGNEMLFGAAIILLVSMIIIVFSSNSIFLKSESSHKK